MVALLIEKVQCFQFYTSMMVQIQSAHTISMKKDGTLWYQMWTGQNGHRPSCVCQARPIESCCIVEKGIIQLEEMRTEQVMPIYCQPGLTYRDRTHFMKMAWYSEGSSLTENQKHYQTLYGYA